MGLSGEDGFVPQRRKERAQCSLDGSRDASIRRRWGGLGSHVWVGAQRLRVVDGLVRAAVLPDVEDTCAEGKGKATAFSLRMQHPGFKVFPARI